MCMLKDFLDKIAEDTKDMSLDDKILFFRTDCDPEDAATPAMIMPILSAETRSRPACVQNLSPGPVGVLVPGGGLGAPGAGLPAPSVGLPGARMALAHMMSQARVITGVARAKDVQQMKTIFTQAWGTICFKGGHTFRI